MGWPAWALNLRRGNIFCTCPRPDLMPIQSHVRGAVSLFLEGKTAETWHRLSTPSSAEVKARLELYLCSPSMPPWHTIGRPLTLHKPFWHSLWTTDHLR